MFGEAQARANLLTIRRVIDGGAVAQDGALARRTERARRSALLPVGVALSAAAINVFVLGREPSSAAELGGLSSLIPTFFILLLIPGLVGTWEEPGFRGYALPRLQIAQRSLPP